MMLQVGVEGVEGQVGEGMVQPQWASRASGGQLEGSRPPAI